MLQLRHSWPLGRRVSRAHEGDAGVSGPRPFCMAPGADMWPSRSGLAAWKSASLTPSQSAPKPHNSGQKRPKGPIITKYAPQPPLQPAYGSSMGHYHHQPAPPPPSHHHKHPPVYHAPPPSQYPHYGAPHPPYPPGPPQPSYGYPPGQAFATPVPYVPPPQYSSTGYLRPAPGPPHPPLHSPPSGPYSGRPNAPDYYYGHPHPPPAAYGHASPQPAPRPPPSGPPPQGRSRPSSSGPSQTPPKQASARISHPLPPKPPPSLDQMKPRNRRKPDSHDHHHDKWQRDHRPNSRQNSHGSQQETRRPSSSASHRHSSPQPSPPAWRPQQDAPKYTAQQMYRSSASARPDAESPAARDGSRSDRAHAPGTEEESVSGAGSGRHEAEDGTAPRAPDAKEPGTVAASPMVEWTRGRDLGSAIEDETASVKTMSTEQEEGEIANDKDGAGPSPPRRAPPNDAHRPWPLAAEGSTSRKRSRSASREYEERQPFKKKKSDSPPPKSEETSESGCFNGTLWDGLDVPRQADRKRRGSVGSRASQQSSVSSKSSDLNSLEAELLGRPVKQKQPECSPPRPRPERKQPLKAKRRQANTNSAYR